MYYNVCYYFSIPLDYTLLRPLTQPSHVTITTHNHALKLYGLVIQHSLSLEEYQVSSGECGAARGILLLHKTTNPSVFSPQRGTHTTSRH